MPIALENSNFIGIPVGQAERDRPLSTITSSVSTRASRVKRYFGYRIFCIRASIAWNQIANSLTRRDHRAVGLAGRIRARHVNVSALLNGRVAIGTDSDAGRQALMHATKIDNQHAVDEHESVVIPEELQLELVAIESE